MARDIKVRNHGCRPVVVGVDGSVSAQRALAWAAGEASDRSCPLRIIHAFSWPTIGSPHDMYFAGPMNIDIRSAAEWIVDDAANYARRLAPGVCVTGELFMAGAAPVLLSAAREAELVVVGSRGLGSLHGRIVGSVSAAVAAHAPCPVIVVRPRPDGTAVPTVSTGRIVVRVDGSEVSAAAIRFAFQEAARRHVGVTAILAVTPSRRRRESTGIVEEINQQLFAESLERLRVSGIDLRTKFVHVHPAEAMVEESAGAELIVVGSSDRGGFVGLLLGSVGQTVLQRARCPVAVVRPRTPPANALPSRRGDRPINSSHRLPDLRELS